MSGLFDGADLIHSYSRAQALEDGTLVDVTPLAKEAGFRWPVAMTRGAFEDCVAWTADDEARKPEATCQDETGRLWDVVWMAMNAARRASGDRVDFELLRVPREGRAVRPRKVALYALVGPGDTPDPVVTIMLPGED